MHISKVLTHQKKLYQGDSHSLDISNRWVTCINDNGTYTIHMFNRSKIVIANDNNVHVIHVSTDQIYQKKTQVSVSDNFRNQLCTKIGNQLCFLSTFINIISQTSPTIS